MSDEPEQIVHEKTPNYDVDKHQENITALVKEARTKSKECNIELN